MTKYFTRYSLRIFLLAMSVLILELAFTRIFSFITFHHLTYLVISVAMLGFGAAGSYLSIRKNGVDDEDDDRFLARNAGLLGITTIGAVVVVPRIHFYPGDIIAYGDSSNLLSLLIIMVVTATPFFFGGVSIANIMSKSGSSVNRIYFADLFGAATGCILSLAIINFIGAVSACFVAAALGLLVATISDKRRRRSYSIGLIVTVLAVPVVANPKILPLYAPPDKQMFRLERYIEKVSWHVITRLDVSYPIDCYCSFGGGISFKYKGPTQKARLIFQDASNLTGIVQPTPTPRETPSLGYYMQGAPYQIKRNAQTLVIGCGGGIDVLIALFHNARQVTAVDVNPKVIQLVTDDFRTFAGNLFQRPDVHPVVSEGRHFLARETRNYDVIQLSGVDTWSALSSGAFALTENLIYTVEAFEQYLRHLTPDGVLNFSRPFTEPPFETLKLVATALSALERRGVTEPYRHLFVMGGMGQYANGKWAQTLVKLSPFTEAETKILEQWTESLGFETIYNPYKPKVSELDSVIRVPSVIRAGIINNYPLHITPATDDSPFYFQELKWADFFSFRVKAERPVAMVVLIAGLVLAILLSGLFIIYPIYHRHSAQAKPGGRTPIFFLFAGLGLGFIMVEMALIQKLTVFLGGPAYSLSVTLFVILISTGLGSFLSQKGAKRPIKLIILVIPLIGVAIFAESFLIGHVSDRLIHLSLIQRASVVTALLAPLGLLMGMPFPAGLRYVNEYRPELSAWAWGVNASATVIGSYLCMLVSTSLGFHAALMFGGYAYLCGWVVFAGARLIGRIKRVS
jgi:SAM-dependent methyltransferase